MGFHSANRFFLEMAVFQSLNLKQWNTNKLWMKKKIKWTTFKVGIHPSISCRCSSCTNLLDLNHQPCKILAQSTFLKTCLLLSHVVCTHGGQWPTDDFLSRRWSSVTEHTVWVCVHDMCVWFCLKFKCSEGETDRLMFLCWWCTRVHAHHS